jgi:hypothetical protein
MRRHFSLTIALAAFATLAAEAAELPPALKACRTIAEDSARARCYDRLIDEANPPPQTSRASPAAPVAAPAPIPAAQAQRFGEHDLPRAQRPAEPAEPDEIVAKVTTITRDTHGRVTVTLDNGQTWRQAENDAITVRVGNSVTIKRGLMGAFYLVPETTRRSYQVRRLQ